MQSLRNDRSISTVLTIPPLHIPLQREIQILWGICRYDISTTIMPGMLFSFAAWHTTIANSQPLGPMLLSSLSYFLLYCFVFCLSNQIAGIAEDRHNKPERPLPSGMMTIPGAWVRWVVAMVLFTVIGWWLDVLIWALLWQITLVLYNFGHGARHFITKNTAMCVGLIAQLAAAWQIVTPITSVAWDWILVPGLVMLTHVSLQDMRDVVGDNINRRHTFPLVMGWNKSRWFLAVAFAILPLITHTVLFMPVEANLATWICSGILTALCLVISARLLWYTTPEAHHRTYMLFTYWYCALLASAIIIL